MRRFIPLILLFFLVFLSSCNSELENGSKIGALGHIKGIQNYENLKGIGAGVVSGESRAADSTGAIKMVGINNDGTYSIVSFINEDGTVVSQDDYCLMNFRDFYSYVFFQFAPPDYLQWLNTSELEECGYFLNERYSPFEHDILSMQYRWSAVNYYLSEHKDKKYEFVVYVLDKDTGKIYELIDNDGDLAVPCFYLMYNNENHYPLYYSTKNYAGFVSATTTLDDERTLIITNYRMSVEDDTLVLEKLQSSAVFNNWMSGGLNDRYGNCYSYDLRFLINNDGQLKALGNNGFMGMNNIFYSSDGQCVNEEGNLEDASFVPSDSYFCREPSKYCIKTAGRESYYLDNTQVVKITFSDDTMIEYTVDRIDLEDYDYKAEYLVAGEKVVYINGSAIAYYSPEDGKKHILNDQYFFNTLSVLSDGSLAFSGVDSNFNVVEGIILEDGTTSTTVSQAQVALISIAPLN